MNANKEMTAEELEEGRKAFFRNNPPCKAEDFDNLPMRHPDDLVKEGHLVPRKISVKEDIAMIREISGAKVSL